LSVYLHNNNNIVR